MDAYSSHEYRSQWRRFVHYFDKKMPIKLNSRNNSFPGVAALNQYIYVVGGFDGTRQLASVERYDTEHAVWDSVAPISIARSALSVTSLDGRLYAMGGFDGFNFLSIVEVYDPELNIWEKGAELTTGRSGHASAVIYKPSGMPAYMDCREIDEHENMEESSASFEIQSNNHHTPSLTAAPSVCNRLHAINESRCNNCNDDSPDATNTASIPSIPLASSGPCPSRPFVEPTASIRTSVITSTNPSSSSNQLNACPALFTNPTSAFSAILAVDRSTSPSSLNDKKRVRVHSFNSHDAIPSKCPTPRDDHAGQQLDREDPRKFRRIYNFGSSSQRFDEGACSSGEGRVSSSPSGDVVAGVRENQFLVPANVLLAPPPSTSGACALFKGHSSEQCSVKALKNNLQRRLRALVTGNRTDPHLPKPIVDAPPRSPDSPSQSTSSQDEDMDT